MYVRMEEEINYSTVVFKNGGQAPKETKEDQTVYSEVKPKGTNTAAAAAASATTVPKADGEAAARSQRCVLAACLGTVCVLLVASIIAIIFITVEMNQQQASLSDLTAENQQLNDNVSVLERRTQELSRDKGDLSRTLGVILKFDTFPVNEYCSNKTSFSESCKPCRQGWIQFQEKCYFFYENGPPWMTWQESRDFCQNKAADLVVIDSLQEQEFIHNNTKFYFTEFHGYWIGLTQNPDGTWVWIDGRNDTLMYWLELATPGPCGLMIPERNLTASWDPADCLFENKFICESEALIKSN